MPTTTVQRWELIRDVVAFCEEHGGSLGGESRARLERLCLEIHEHGSGKALSSTEARCGECGSRFPIPAIARCPECSSSQVRRAGAIA